MPVHHHVLVQLGLGLVVVTLGLVDDTEAGVASEERLLASCKGVDVVVDADVFWPEVHRVDSVTVSGDIGSVIGWKWWCK